MDEEDKHAIKIKNDVTKYVDKYINSRDKYFYRFLTSEIEKILNETNNITYKRVGVENHILYVRWQFKTSQQILCISCNLKDIKIDEAI